MRAFVIKVKENCYWLGGFYGKDNYDDIAHAKVYVNKTQAEKQCKLVNKSYGHNAEVVEITIAEGDLEQQLAEKDKEIEELKDTKNRLANTLDVLFFGKSDTEQCKKVFESQIRHQVCDEIRKKLKAHCDYTDEEHIGWYISEEKIDIILDQIDKENNNEHKSN